VPVEKDDGCETNAKLDGMASAMNETLKGTEESMVASVPWRLDRLRFCWCGIGAVAVEIVTHPPRNITPVPAWSPPTYDCFTTQDGFLWSHCKIWTETRSFQTQSAPA
jgi:hypothetical protein